MEAFYKRAEPYLNFITPELSLFKFSVWRAFSSFTLVVIVGNATKFYLRNGTAFKDKVQEIKMQFYTKLETKEVSLTSQR